jgi:predicted AlkP superfamily phosphohydrolase/phosphomutase
MNTPIKSYPLVILGLDAGDANLIEKWAKEGYLHNINSIMNRGCWGRTTGVDLINEDGVWTRLFSGVSQKEHGFYYFRQLKTGSYDLYTVEKTEATKKVFWANYQGSDKKVALIDIPDLDCLPNLQGVQLFNWAVHNSHYIPPSSYPGNLLATLNQKFGQPDNINENFTSNLAEDKKIYQRLKNRLARKGELCRYLLTQDSYDLIVAVFGECHTGGHQFWKYRPEAQGDEKVTTPTELTYAIREIYQAIDREIGLILQELPPNASVVIASSVGLIDRYSTEGLIEDFCYKLGYQKAISDNNSARSFLDILRHVIPETWRTFFSRHLPRDIKEKIFADTFRRKTDWSQTKAFAIPSAYMSFIRVNLQGREPQGIVKPGVEYEAILNQIKAELFQLIDERSGQKAIQQVWRSSQIFGNDINSELPDLLIEWQPQPYFMESVYHPRAKITQTKPEFFRGSDHTHEGFIAFAGDLISHQGNLGNISFSSLHSTFLSLMNNQVPDWM